MCDMISKDKRKLIKRFTDYQIAWLTSHNDLSLIPEIEELVAQFIQDTAACFILEEGSND